MNQRSDPPSRISNGEEEEERAQRGVGRFRTFLATGSPFQGYPLENQVREPGLSAGSGDRAVLETGL
jgi:hypothetical protein